MLLRRVAPPASYLATQRPCPAVVIQAIARPGAPAAAPHSCAPSPAAAPACRSRRRPAPAAPRRAAAPVPGPAAPAACAGTPPVRCPGLSRSAARCSSAVQTQRRPIRSDQILLFRCLSRNSGYLYITTHHLGHSALCAAAAADYRAPPVSSLARMDTPPPRAPAGRSAEHRGTDSWREAQGPALEAGREVARAQARRVQLQGARASGAAANGAQVGVKVQTRCRGRHGGRTRASARTWRGR